MSKQSEFREESNCLNFVFKDQTSKSLPNFFFATISFLFSFFLSFSLSFFFCNCFLFLFFSFSFYFLFFLDIQLLQTIRLHRINIVLPDNCRCIWRGFNPKMEKSSDICYGSFLSIMIKLISWQRIAFTWNT